VKIKEVKYKSEDYQKLLSFRFQNLRKPLNLLWSKEDLQDEDKQNHFALMHNLEIIGSFCLKKIDTQTIKIRQMAIKKGYQKKGYGSEVIRFTESFAGMHNYKIIILTARLSALEFYEKNLFKTSGKIFVDVSVDSIKMFKFI
jgi:GNAT superfamily N-acetyltransferase